MSPHRDRSPPASADTETSGKRIPQDILADVQKLPITPYFMHPLHCMQVLFRDLRRTVHLCYCLHICTCRLLSTQSVITLLLGLCLNFYPFSLLSGVRSEHPYAPLTRLSNPVDKDVRRGHREREMDIDP